MRSVGSEILSAAAVLLVPAGIVASFPVGAFGFRTADGVRRSARAAFVKLTPEAERLALRAARTSWQEKDGGVRHLRTDIFCAELPEEAPVSVLSVRDRSLPPAPPAPLRGRTAFLPSLRAAPLTLIKAGSEADPPAFSREELLKLN